MPVDLEQAREAFSRGAWQDAFRQLAVAAGDSGLGVDDLERLAVAAYLTGREQISIDTWTRAYQDAARRHDAPGAARFAFWIAFILLNKGELAGGGGWVHRGQRQLDKSDDRVEHGYLRYAASLRIAFEGDMAGAREGFAEAAAIGDRFGDAELTALARVGEGRCLISVGDLTGGMACLDEGMIAVTAREVSATAVGDLYCTVIEGCQDAFDVRRAQEWTSALSRWCDSQPELVLYRGQCLVHRAELMVLGGAWSDAVTEAKRAVDRLAQPTNVRAMGAAHYVRAELHRLRGESAGAEAAYERANAFGRSPHPGLAQLWVAQGRVAEAVAAIRRALDEEEDPAARTKLLGPFVEIMLAAGEVQSAQDAADELAATASEVKTPMLLALSSHATGAVLFARDDARDALVALRRALAGWLELEAPHEAARARMLIGLACRSMGDERGAEMELAAARSVFSRLHAAPDLERLDEVASGRGRGSAAGLTAREIEVLRLVATGRSNRDIADELVISEKTVASHVGSVLSKLGLPSRSAATAYAYEHDLL